MLSRLYLSAISKYWYRKNVESMVQDISLETVSLSDLNAKLQVFCDVLVDAAEKSAPCI